MATRLEQIYRALLEREGLQVVGEAANGQEALQVSGTLPKTKPILLTMHSDSRYILEGFRGGAKGYVMKTQAAELVRPVREAARGGTYLSPEIANLMVQAYQNKTTIADPLSARERQVLQLIAEVKTSKKIARFPVDRTPGASQGAKGGNPGTVHGNSWPTERLAFGPRIPNWPSG